MTLCDLSLAIVFSPVPLCFNTFDWSFSHTVAPIKPRVWAGCAMASFTSTLCSLIKKNVSSSNYHQSIYWGVFLSVSGISALSFHVPFQRKIDIGDKTDANYADFFFKWSAVKRRKRNESSIFWWFLKYKWGGKG